MGTAPLCSRGGQAPWAPSQNLVLLDGLQGQVEPAAGMFQYEDLYPLENNLLHSPPGREIAPDTGPGQAAELACRLRGGLS